MEKKNFQRAGSKSLASDSHFASKQFNNNARRREGAAQSFGKNETQRSNKNLSVKNRQNVDKRPRPRGSDNSFNSNISSTSSRLADENSDESLSNEIDIDLNSIFLPGTKKQNLNHLLNFHYRQRENVGVNFSDFHKGRMRDSFKKQTQNGIVLKHKYKEQFLQANFQFVVKSTAEEIVNNALPDSLIDWNLIEQVNIHTTTEIQCPICLYPPIAGKLTRCGHAYCWPCILHYLALSDKAWRKCPICYEPVYVNDLKSTEIILENNFDVGEKITLQLMRRKKYSKIIEQVENSSSYETFPHLLDDMDLKKFSKFVLVDCNEVMTIIEREYSDLLNTDHDCPEFIFIQQALDLLEERKKIIKQEIHVINTREKNVKQNIEKSTQDKNGDINVFKINPIPSNEAISEKYYYFYQCIDGQNIYIHALNIKELQAMYGSLENSPSKIEGKILQKESYSMNEELRKRLKYLQHLPLICQFEVVELQLEPPIISEDIIEMFRGEIILRQKNRMRRAREERKRERHINEINDRQMGKLISSTANIDISSSLQFPTCGLEDFTVSESSQSETVSSALDIPTKNMNKNGISFAEMLSSPKKEFWPSLNSVELDSNDVNKSSSYTKWASNVLPITKILSDSENCNDSNIDAMQCPKKQDLGCMLIEALEQNKINERKIIETKNNTGKNKKQKKNKKTLLFSTGMNFDSKN